MVRQQLKTILTQLIRKHLNNSPTVKPFCQPVQGWLFSKYGVIWPNLNANPACTEGLILSVIKSACLSVNSWYTANITGEWKKENMKQKLTTAPKANKNRRKKRRLTVDFETRSEVDIDIGAWNYSKDSSTQVLVLSFSDETDPPDAVESWRPLENEKPPLWIKDDLEFDTYNYFFEYCIWNHVLTRTHGFPPIGIEKFDCTRALALSFGLPDGLDKAAEVLRLPVQKDLEGAALMRLMSRPKKPGKKDDPKKRVWIYDREKIERLTRYCETDVTVTRHVRASLPAMPEDARRMFEFDRRLNLRGIKTDAKYIDNVIKKYEIGSINADAEIVTLTDGAVQSVRQRDRLLEWIRGRGVDIPGMRKNQVAETLTKPNLPDDVRTVLETRAQFGRSSVSKFFKLAEQIDRGDHRLRDHVVFMRSHTGRYSSYGVQVLNMVHPPGGAAVDSYNQAHKTKLDGAGVTEALIKKTLSGKLNADDVGLYAANLIRGAFIPEKGNALYMRDFSNIETRGLFWLAGEKAALADFAAGDAAKRNGDTEAAKRHDLYRKMAVSIYALKDVFAVNDDQRQLGKKSILGCGYQMSADKFHGTCISEGLIIEKDLARLAVETYRGDYPGVVRLWYAMQDAAVAAVLKPGKRFAVAGGKIAFQMNRAKTILLCILPSGRMLRYWHPRIIDKVTPWGAMKPALHYERSNLQTGQLEIVSTYGGKLVENAVQALCYDIQAAALLRMDAAGFNVVLPVHDEIVTEDAAKNASDRRKRELQMQAIMETPPEWAAGFPIFSEGGGYDRYIFA